MNDAIFQWALQNVFHHEGGFVNHASDPGGATNFGISVRYLVARGDLDRNGVLDGDLDHDGDVDIDDIKGMSVEQATEFYRTGFWIPSKCDQLSSELLAVKIFDMVVNMGQVRAWRIAQTAFNLVSNMPLLVDGVVGPSTIKAFNDKYARDYVILEQLRSQQAYFYTDLIKENNKLVDFKTGWLRRAAA